MISPQKVRGELDLSYGNDSIQKDDKKIAEKNQQNMSNTYNGNDILISPKRATNNNGFFQKPNSLIKTQPTQHQKKTSEQIQSFTDRENSLNHIHLLTKTYQKEGDKKSQNITPNSSNPTTKSQTYFPSNTKYSQSLQFKSPITSQTSSRQNIQNGELSTGNEIDGNKTNNSHLPNLQLYDQLYNQKNTAYFQTNEFSISQQKNQITQKGLSTDALHKINKSQPELFQNQDMFKEKYSILSAQSRQKFLTIRNPKQDYQIETTFFNGNQSTKNFSQNYENSLSPNQMLKKKQDFRTQNEKKEDKVVLIFIYNVSKQQLYSIYLIAQYIAYLKLNQQHLSKRWKTLLQFMYPSLETNRKIIKLLQNILDNLLFLNNPFQTKLFQFLICLFVVKNSLIYQNFKENQIFQINKKLKNYFNHINVIQNRQDNMYGDQMKTFFDIIQQMIICEDQNVVNRMKQFKSLKKKKQAISNIPAFFQCAQILSEEIEYLTQYHENSINQMQIEKDKIIQEYSNFKQKHQDSQAEQKNQIQQTEKQFQTKLSDCHQQQIIINQKIETLIQQQEEFQKDIQMTKENLRQSKQETEKQMRNVNNLNYSLQQAQQKITELQQQISTQSTEIQTKDNNIQLCTQQIEDNQTQLEQRTPRPRLDSFFKLFETVDSTFSNEEKGLKTQEKVEYLYQKAQQVVVDLQQKEEESQKKNSSKSKSQNRLKSQQNSKDIKSSPPKTRGQGIKPSNGLKQENSINIYSGGSSSSITVKNPKDMLIKGINEIKQRLKQKKQLTKKGAQDSEQIDIFTLPSNSSNNPINNSNITNQQQRLSTFSKSNRSISRKASNVYSLQRQSSRATLASLDSIDIGERVRNKKSDNISQSQLEQISSFNEDTIAMGGFKRSNKSRAQTNITKKKTVIFEEVR